MSICVNDTVTKVNVNVNIGAGFYFNLPKETIIENIIFDYAGSTGNTASDSPPITKPKFMVTLYYF